MSRCVLLILGDALALILVTGAGFATHGELGSAPFSRVLATLLPLMDGWALVAPWLGLFDPAVTANPRLLWRPVYATLLAGPIAAFLRGAALDSIILPLFVAVHLRLNLDSIGQWRSISPATSSVAARWKKKSAKARHGR